MKSEVKGLKDGILEVSLAAKPKDGEANEELRSVLSRFFDVPKMVVSIVYGATSRNKVVTIAGLTDEEFLRRVDGIEEKETKEA
jgi:uncharacterized protein